MNYSTLCNIDDLCKVLLVDQYNGSTKKMKPRELPLLKFIKNKLLKICEDFLKTGNTKETLDALIEIAREQRLFFFYSIGREQWLKIVLEMYLEFFHPSSKVKLIKCDRYSLDGYNGITIIATEDLKVNFIVNNIFGIFQPLTSVEENDLIEKKLDFSILINSRTQKPSILLGSVAFLNHDCSPNCEYYSRNKTVISVQIIKNIKKDEELFVYYGNDYFGPNNIDCECNTCKKRDSKYEYVNDKNPSGNKKMYINVNIYIFM